MQFAVLLAAIDILLVIHAAKTGRFTPWGYVIMLLPGIGAAAYVIAELAPEWLGSYKGQKAQSNVISLIDPTRRYRLLKDNLETADTIANHAALGEECLTLGRYEEALALFTAVIGQLLGEEPGYFLGKARAEYGAGQPAAAIATLDTLRQTFPDKASAEGHLLYARALEGAGRDDEALAEYGGVSAYFPGPEPRVRHAVLLARLGRAAEARSLADDTVRRIQRSPRHVRQAQGEWLAQAQKIARGVS